MATELAGGCGDRTKTKPDERSRGTGVVSGDGVDKILIIIIIAMTMFMVLSS